MTYALANHLDTEAKEAYNKIILKYTHPTKLAQFKVLYALYRKDIKTAKTALNDVKPPELKLYYEIQIALEENDLEKSRLLIQSVKKTWMQNAVEADILHKEGNLEQARIYAEQSIKRTRGIQKYTLAKHFEPLLNKAA